MNLMSLTKKILKVKIAFNAFLIFMDLIMYDQSIAYTVKSIIFMCFILKNA